MSPTTHEVIALRSRLGIGHRLAGAFGGLVLLTLGLGLVAIASLNGLSDTYEHALARSVRAEFLALRLKQDVTQETADVRGYVFTGAQDFRESIALIEEDFARTARDIRQEVVLAEQPKIAAIVRAYDAWDRGPVARAIAARARGDVARAARLLVRFGIPANRRIHAILDPFVQQQKQHQQQAVLRAARSATFAKGLVVLASLAAVLLACVLGFGITRSIVRPLRRLAGASLRLGAGRLETRANGGGGGRELESLAMAFNEMAAALEADRRRFEVSEAEQASLRRVATAVATERETTEIFSLVAEEAARLLDADAGLVCRFEPQAAVPVGWWGVWQAMPKPFPLGGAGALSQVHRTGAAIRVDDYAQLADDPVGRLATAFGYAASIAAPIQAESRPWGALLVSTRRAAGFPAGAEERLADFAELVGLAVANAANRERLIGALHDRRLLLAQLVRAQAEERRRIAADVHDDSIQVMAAVALRLDILQQHLADPDQREQLEVLMEVVRQALSRLRNLVFDLHPPSLEKHGIVAALRQRLEHMRESSGIPWRIEGEIATEPPVDIGEVIYLIAQEALANVAKHSQASSVVVRVEEVDGGVRLEIHDDGVGMDGAPVPVWGHVGLVAMRERAEIAGGRLQITSLPGAGTTVECWIPPVPPEPGAGDQRRA